MLGPVYNVSADSSPTIDSRQGRLVAIKFGITSALMPFSFFCLKRGTGQQPSQSGLSKQRNWFRWTSALFCSQRFSLVLVGVILRPCEHTAAGSRRARRMSRVLRCEAKNPSFVLKQSSVLRFEVKKRSSLVRIRAKKRSSCRGLRREAKVPWWG